MNLEIDDEKEPGDDPEDEDDEPEGPEMPDTPPLGGPAPALAERLQALETVLATHDRILQALPDQLKSSFGAVTNQIDQLRAPNGGPMQPQQGGGLMDLIGKFLTMGGGSNEQEEFFKEMGRNQYMYMTAFMNKQYAKLLGLPDHVTID